MVHLARTARRARHVLELAAWVLTGAIVALLAVAVAVPRLGGATPYAVLTGSMSPGMPAGSLVVVRPRPVEQIGIGDVVTYQLRSGRPAVVTHRVVAVGHDGEGAPVWQTQGDANPTPDQQWVRAAQVRGVRWYAVPLLGHLTVALDGVHRRGLDVGIGLALLAYAGWLGFGSLRNPPRDPAALSGGLADGVPHHA